MQAIDELVAIEATPEQVDAHPCKQLKAMLRQVDSGAIHAWGGTVFRYPFISRERAAEILAEAGDYKANPYEEPEVQMDECIIEGFDVSFIDDFTMLVYQGLFRGHVQLAKGGNTGWHHDAASDLTIVISLSDGVGGTMIRTAANRKMLVPHLPIGWGLVFPGKMLHHHGVAEGNRDLLVLWLEAQK